MTTEIFVVDNQNPEDLAMLQALYSRSPASVLTHLEKLKQSGSGKFMDQYYVGYGHASIGDCGGTTCFIEQVSMLVAKAVQDHPLYNGQEASTRYLDFSQQAVVDPYRHPASTSIQNFWMEIYHATLPRLVAGLEARYPYDAAVYKTEKIWQNALKARAFDIGRGLLPIGTTTLLSWTTTLRQSREHLRRLKEHPLPEVRDVALEIFAKLFEKYPHSFNGDDMATESGDPRRTYAAEHAMRNNFLDADEVQRRYAVTASEKAALTDGQLLVRREAMDVEGARGWEKETLASRPARTPLPWRLESYGRYNFLFLLDFGSFRDIHRHRNAVCQVPLVDGRYGLHPWYKEQFTSLLSAADSAALFGDIAAQFERIAGLAKMDMDVVPTLTQYLYPMGTQTLVHASYSLPETVYVGELRASKTVHPSLRPVAQNMLRVLAQDFPGMALHGDMEEDSWTAKRGEQTIRAKESAA